MKWRGKKITDGGEEKFYTGESKKKPKPKTLSLAAATLGNPKKAAPLFWPGKRNQRNPWLKGVFDFRFLLPSAGEGFFCFSPLGSTKPIPSPWSSKSKPESSPSPLIFFHPEPELSHLSLLRLVANPSLCKEKPDQPLTWHCSSKPFPAPSHSQPTNNQPFSTSCQLKAFLPLPPEGN